MLHFLYYVHVAVRGIAERAIIQEGAVAFLAFARIGRAFLGGELFLPRAALWLESGAREDC